MTKQLYRVTDVSSGEVVMIAPIETVVLTLDLTDSSMAKISRLSGQDARVPTGKRCALGHNEVVVEKSE